MDLENIVKDFVNYVQEHQLLLEGIAIADEKNVLIEHRFTPDLPRQIYSHTKSYTSTAVGIAVSEGKLSLDDRLVDYFPEYVPKEPGAFLPEIRLRHLLTMASGFDQPYLMAKRRAEGVGLPDYIAYLFSQPVKRKPGERFVYSNGDTYLAGRMVEKAVGMRLSEYLYERLFLPLGQGWPAWECDAKGHPFGASGLIMRLTDMMKLGQLYLGDGMWQGKRLVPHDWIAEATSKKIGTEEETNGEWWTCGYGYQFWVCPYPDAYRADGAYGQVTAVLPHSGLVVAVQCPDYGDFFKVWKVLHTEVLMKLVG